MILIIGDEMHKKNIEGLNKMLSKLNMEYKYGEISEIEDYKIIFHSSQAIDTSKYPKKRFIFGPHFSTFPNEKLNGIINKHNNSVYIQPSIWTKELWEPILKQIHLPIKVFSFPVNMEKFKPDKKIEERNRIFIYFKRRNPDELMKLINFCKKNNILPIVFDYVKKYEEEDYLDCLKNAKFGIILDAHESQGFAIEEALSCNVPLLVWNVKTMNQEYGSKYGAINCTSVPYWDGRCGEIFYNIDELEDTFKIFIEKLHTYEPRKYIEENLSVEKCAERLKELLDERI
jgi:glycosyltransferase involved in cell wall biosynthesis